MPYVLEAGGGRNIAYTEIRGINALVRGGKLLAAELYLFCKLRVSDLAVGQLLFQLINAVFRDVRIILKRQACKALEVIKLLKVGIGDPRLLQAEYLQIAELCETLRTVNIVAAENELLKLLQLRKRRN